MEPFSINLNQMAEKGGRYKRMLIFLTAIFLIISLGTFFIFYSKDDPKEWIFLAFAVYSLAFIYFGYVGYKAEMFVNSDDYALEYQFGFFKKVPQKIIWETIVKVKLGPTYLAFFKKTGKRKVIQLGWLPYAKVVEIKDKVQKVAVEKNIEVEVADYQKG